MTQKGPRERREKMAFLVADGKSLAAVARQFGVSTGNVYEACHEWDVSLRTMHTKANKCASLRAMFKVVRHLQVNPQATLVEVGGVFNVTRQRIHQIKKAAIGAGLL